jgi:hypothetical protein
MHLLNHGLGNVVYNPFMSPLPPVIHPKQFPRKFNHLPRVRRAHLVRVFYMTAQSLRIPPLLSGKFVFRKRFIFINLNLQTGHPL